MPKFLDNLDVGGVQIKSSNLISMNSLAPNVVYMEDASYSDGNNPPTWTSTMKRSSTNSPFGAIPVFGYGLGTAPRWVELKRETDYSYAQTTDQIPTVNYLPVWADTAFKRVSATASISISSITATSIDLYIDTFLTDAQFQAITAQTTGIFKLHLLLKCLPPAQVLKCIRNTSATKADFVFITSHFFTAPNLYAGGFYIQTDGTKTSFSDKSITVSSITFSTENYTTVPTI